MGQSNAVIDGVLSEAGQPGGEVRGEHVVYMELGVDWTSTRSKVRAGNRAGGSAPRYAKVIDGDR